jgi:hypothetical protein
MNWNLMKYDEELARLRKEWAEQPEKRWAIERQAKMIKNARELYLRKNPQQKIL